MSAHPQIDLASPSGFSLEASSRFVMRYAPGQGGGQAPVLHLAFALDRRWSPVGVRVTQTADALEAEVVANPERAPMEQIKSDLERILSLRADGAAFRRIGRRDPVVAALQNRYPGLRPVQFNTPYEAAAWTIIGHRIRITQAATIKNQIAADRGTEVTFADGAVLHAFPAPEELLRIRAGRGLAERKIEQLHALARGALAGELDTELILGAAPEEALRRLQRLPGIGPFSAELILVRGAGYPDYFPQYEQRLHKAMEALYQAEPEEFPVIAEKWRPFRSWVALLIRSWLEDETHEIKDGHRATKIPTHVTAG